MSNLAIIGCVILLTVGALCQRSTPFLDLEIKGEVTLSPEWLEIKPNKPLKPTREFQQVVLGLAEPYVGDFGAKGVRLPDGSVVTPQVQLVDENGNIFDLKYGGFRGRMNIYFSNFEQLPKDRNYRTVRIRSEKPIHCNKIFWSSYYSKDLE
jgi:hypothetical protein